MQLSRDQLTAYLYSRGIWQAGRYAGTSSVDLGDNTGYIVTQQEPPGLRESQIAAVANPAGFEAPYVVPADYQGQIASMQYVPDWRAATRAANNGGGIVEALAMAGISAAVGSALWSGVGSLSEFGSIGSGTAEATAGIESASESIIGETATAATETATTGASTVDEWGMDLFNSSGYAVDPAGDPFATTESVNAGWTESNGYGVNYYNTAGIGQASLSSSVDSIMGTVNKVVSGVSKVFATGSAALAATRNNLAQQPPNYTRALGGLNVGTLAIAAIGFLALKG